MRKGKEESVVQIVESCFLYLVVLPLSFPTAFLGRLRWGALGAMDTGLPAFLVLVHEKP